MRQTLIRQTLATCVRTAGLLLALAGTVVTHAQTVGFAPEDQQAFEERVAGRMLHVSVTGGTDSVEFEFSDDGSGIVTLLGSLGYTYSRTGPNTATLSVGVAVGLNGCRTGSRVFLNFNSRFDGTGWIPDPFDITGDSGCSIEFQIERVTAPSVLISPTDLQIDEGESGSYEVSLGSVPEGTVTVSIDVLPPVFTVFPPGTPFDVSVSTTRLSFSSSNWSDPQTVTFRVAEDNHVSGDIGYAIIHSVSGYGNLTTADRVEVLAVDNDVAGVTVTPTALTVVERETGTYTVVLDTDPDPGRDGLTVTVTPSSNNPDVTTEPSFLTFTSANWNVSRTVTVRAARDGDGDDESATLTHAVTGYGDVTDGGVVEVTVLDDAEPLMRLSPNRPRIEEGGSGTYQVSLENEPLRIVTVEIEPDEDNPDVTVSPTSLTFDAANWNSPRTVTVSAAEDDDTIDDAATVVTTAKNHHGEAYQTWFVHVTVVDNDGRAVTVSPATLTLDEGSTGSYTVVLESRPQGTVTITPGSSNPQVSVSPASLSFDAGNWDSPQAITVAAAEDDDAIDDIATLMHTVTGYGDVTDGGAVEVTVVDDDEAGVLVSTDTLTIEEGGSDTYQVSLESEPPGNVTITPRSDNPNVAVSPASLTFTPSDWNSPQAVTVSTAEDDDALDERATLSHDVSGYGAVTAADDVAVTVTDTATVPGAPRDLTATPGDRQVSLQWREPATDGGSPIIRYDYQVDDDQWVSTGGTATSYVVRNLANGTTYTFRVRAVNSVSEDSPSSESVSESDSATPSAGEEVKEAVTETVEAVTAATAANITANIGTRFSATPSSGSVVVGGGRTLNLGSGSTSSELLSDTRRNWDSVAKPGLADETLSLGGEELLRYSAFEISLNAADDGDEMGAGAAQWTVWGRGDLQFFESRPERGATYDGDLSAGYLGIDARLDDRWLAGLAVSRTNAEADYDTGGDGSADGGRLEVTLTGVHPYLRYVADARSEFWTILGAGWGEIENASAGDTTLETSDMRMWMGAVGIRHSLDPVESLDFAYLSDVGFARVETDDGFEAIDGLTVDTWRLRMGVEASHTAELENGAALTSFAEVAGRFDGGGGEDEIGMEISPGFYLSDPSLGFGVEVRGRLLALHSAENYKERGLSMTVSLSPRSDGLGLSLSLSPRWGTPTGDAETLWRDHALERLDSREARRDSLSFDARVGYGLRSMNGAFTPFGEFGVRDRDRRRVRVGAQFNRRSTSLGDLSVELSGERRDSAWDDSEHRVDLVGRLRF